MIEPLKIENIPKAEAPIINPADYLIDPNKAVPEPSPILAYTDGIQSVPIFTEDNISMIQGKAKSRKSTFIKALSVAICSGRYGLLKSNYQRNAIAILDTEQSHYHCYRAVSMIRQLSGRTISYYSVAGTTAEQKKFLVESHLKRHPQCGFMILDNIVHFLMDFNSPVESSELNQWLIKMKNEYKTHICVVLHENGSDIGNGKAKGHLGTLLENTCETIIRVEKSKDDKNISIVSPKAMRGIEFEPFIIQTDYQGVPHLSEYKEPPPKAKIVLV